MAEQARPIEDLVRTLGPEQQEAVRRFIEALASKSDNTAAPEPAFAGRALCRTCAGVSPPSSFSIKLRAVRRYHVGST